MQNPLHHGVLTTFCLDRKHHWMMLGTTHGVLDLWDLRFKLRLRSFGIGGAGTGSRVDRLLLHPSRRPQLRPRQHRRHLRQDAARALHLPRRPRLLFCLGYLGPNRPRPHVFPGPNLLWPLRPQSHVPLALICVAEGAEIYSVMSSALMQRRTFQITDPLLAFVLSPDECTLQLVIGWVEEHPTHQCVRVFANLWPSL